MKEIDRILIESGLKEMEEERLEDWLTFSYYYPKTEEEIDRESEKRKRLEVVNKYLSEKTPETCKECPCYKDKSLRQYCELVTDQGYCEEGGLHIHNDNGILKVNFQSRLFR